MEYFDGLERDLEVCRYIVTPFANDRSPGVCKRGKGGGHGRRPLASLAATYVQSICKALCMYVEAVSDSPQGHQTGKCRGFEDTKRRHQILDGKKIK
jgi:hypothetical protein